MLMCGNVNWALNRSERRKTETVEMRFSAPDCRHAHVQTVYAVR
jgi:hypothetical protein